MMVRLCLTGLVILLLISYTYPDSVDLFNQTIINPPLDQVMEHNNDLVEDMLPFHENFGSVPENEGPVIFSDLRILSVDPSIDNHVSNLHIPIVIWGWGEKHLDKYEESWEETCCDHEYTHKIIWESDGEPYLSDAKMVFEFEGINRSLGLITTRYYYDNGTEITDLSELNITGNLSDDVLENLSIRVEHELNDPVEVPFTTEELDINPDNRTPDLPKLTIKLSGTINFPYKRREVYKVERWNDEGCSCESEVDDENVIIKKRLSDQRTYYVENHNLTGFLAKPVTHEMSYLTSNLEYFLFGNRFPQKIVYSVDGLPFAVYYVYHYKVEESPYGFWRVKTIPSYKEGFASGDLDLPMFVDLLVKNLTVFRWKKRYYIHPFQIHDTSESYVNVYNIRMYFNSSGLLGPHTYRLYFYDWFGDRFMVGEDRIFVRVPVRCYYYLQPNYILFTVRGPNDQVVSLPIIVKDEEGNPISYLSSEEGYLIPRQKNHVITAMAVGNDQFRGCSINIVDRGVWNDNLKVCLPVIIILAVLYGVAYRISGKIFIIK